MILTDGKITDMEDTIDAVVDASFLPISLIIIGIGKADFSDMERLDADVNPLINSKGVRQIRDLVQFVEFNKLENNGNKLAEEVLNEVPSQVEIFHKIINKIPNPPINLQI